MFVNNTAKKDIKLNSFDGYILTIPPGVSWIWDKAGEHLTTKIYKVESTGVDKYGLSNGNGIPPLLVSNQAAWEKGGKKLTAVERFQVKEKLIPRAKLISLAKERGVDDKEVVRFLTDTNIDPSIIAEAINNLPVPEEIRYPAILESTPESVPETVASK